MCVCVCARACVWQISCMYTYIWIDRYQWYFSCHLQILKVKLSNLYLHVGLTCFLQVFSWSSKRRSRTRCLMPSGRERTGSSSTRWSTTRLWWAPGNISSARALKASSTEPSTGPPRRAAKRKTASRSLAKKQKAPPPTTEDWKSPCGEGDRPSLPPASSYLMAAGQILMIVLLALV